MVAESVSVCDWARRPGEPWNAYAAFVAYRELPLERRCAANTARELSASDDAGRCHEWCREYGWPWRAESWDHDRRTFEAANEHTAARTLRDMNDRQARLAVALQTLVAKQIQSKDGPKEKLGDLARTVHLATRIERTARLAAAETVDDRAIAEERRLFHGLYRTHEGREKLCDLLETLADDDAERLGGSGPDVGPEPLDSGPPSAPFEPPAGGGGLPAPGRDDAPPGTARAVSRADIFRRGSRGRGRGSARSRPATGRAVQGGGAATGHMPSRPCSGRRRGGGNRRPSGSAFPTAWSRRPGGSRPWGCRTRSGRRASGDR